MREKKYKSQQVKVSSYNPRGNLVIPEDIRLKKTARRPALEMIAKKSTSENPICLFASPPKIAKGQCQFSLSDTNTLIESPVYFFKAEPHVGLLPKKSQNCVVLNLNDDKIVVRFFQEDKFANSKVEIKLPKEALEYFKKQAIGKIDLQKDGQIVNPILTQALKEANRLNNSFAKELGYIQYAKSHLDEQSKPVEREYNIPIEYVFDEKTEVVATPVPKQDPAGPQIYEVRVFARIAKIKEEKSGWQFRPEVSENTETVAKGFMFGSDLQATRKQLKPSSVMLFTTKPHSGLTRQRSLGNCFLLASIEAILATEGGPEYIMSMMKQDEKGVTVRLYERNAQGEFVPVFVHVANEILYDGFGQVSKHEGGLWLHVLESAYAILGTHDNQTNETFCPSFLTSYGSGGDPYLAMQTLTGVEAKSYQVAPDSNSLPKFKMKSLLAEIGKFDEKTAKSELQEIIAKQLPNDSLLRFLFQNDDNIILFLQQINKDHSQHLKNLSALGNFDVTPIASQDGFEKALKTFVVPSLKDIIEKFDETARSKLLPCLDSNKEIKHGAQSFHLLSGPLFSGQYTLHEVNVYERISQALREKSLVTCTTPSGNSPPGLVDGHVYTVIGSETIKGKHFISVRNPWNYYSLKYSKSIVTGKMVRTSNFMSGISKIELGDFCRFFKDYDIGKIPIVPSLGLNKIIIPKLNQQLKVDQLNQVVFYLESGFITYGLLQANIDEKTSSQLLTETQKLFLHQELASYIEPFKNFIGQKITALNEILPISVSVEIKTPIPGEDSGAFKDQIESLLNPAIHLPMEKFSIVQYLKAVAENENPQLRSYATALLLLIEQVKQIEVNLTDLQSSTQLSTAVINAKDYMETFKKVPRLVEEIVYLSRSMNHIFSKSTLTLLGSASSQRNSKQEPAPSRGYVI